MDKLLRYVFIVLMGLSLAGCANFKEHMKGFMGISTREIEAGRKTAITRTVGYDYATAFKMVSNVLQQMESYVYAGDISKYMLAVYRSNTDTTPVGIYFKVMSSSSTQIEVSSPSSFTKAEVADKIFAAFGGDVPHAAAANSIDASERSAKSGGDGATPSQPK